MSQRDEEFHQIVPALEHICDANGVVKVPLAFCCPRRCYYSAMLWAYTDQRSHHDIQYQTAQNTNTANPIHTADAGDADRTELMTARS